MQRVDPAIRKQLSRISKLTIKIEQTAVPTPKTGYLENRFYTFDRIDLTDQVLSLFKQLIVDAPDEEYFRYLYAGSLARANRLEEAEAIYRGIRESGGHYSRHAVLMLVSIYLQLGNREAAEEALNDHNRRQQSEGFPQLKRTLEDLEIRRAS
jgi:predicted Zn-dependent protease